MPKTAVKISEATIGIESNRTELLPSFPLKIEVPSLLTDFHEVEELPYSDGLDGYIRIEDRDENPVYSFDGREVLFRGPFYSLDGKISDSRFTFWGNQGFLYRFALYLLEKHHEIFSLHACGLYDESQNTLYVVTGGAGSGKTVFLLSGLLKGLQLFSTETVHFRIRKSRITWFMGSLVDNVRLGTLMYDFPHFLPPVKKVPASDAWQNKTAVDLSPYKARKERLVDPEVVILFPHVEQGWTDFQLHPVDSRAKRLKILFDNISQKITETTILFDQIPVLGLDEKPLAGARMAHIEQLLEHRTVSLTASILTNPNDCWGNFLS